MHTDQKTLEKVFSHIDREELAQLAMDVVNFPTPTGSEEEVARFIHDWLQKPGHRDLPAAHRAGARQRGGGDPGYGRGSHAAVQRHMDTALSGGQEDLWITGSSRPEWQALARREDDVIYGSGIVNDKGPLTCTLVMAKALKESGVKLKGDVIVTGVAGRSAVRRWTTTRVPPTGARDTARATW